MITAKEARQIVEKLQETETKDILDAVEKAIIREAQKEETSVKIPYILPDNVISILSENGFEIAFKVDEPKTTWDDVRESTIIFW